MSKNAIDKSESKHNVIIVVKIASAKIEGEYKQGRMTADLYGDFRDELVLLTTTEDGGKVVTVVTSPEPINKMFVTPAEILDYRLWLAQNMGGGYRSIYDQPLIQPKTD